MATAVLTEGARVWPSAAGFWSGLFGGRVSTGAPVAAGACPSSCPLAPQAARTRAAAETAKRAGRMAAPEQRGVEGGRMQPHRALREPKGAATDGPARNPCRSGLNRTKGGDIRTPLAPKGPSKARAKLPCGVG